MENDKDKADRTHMVGTIIKENEMSRYIDADALRKLFDENLVNVCHDVVLKVIDEAPSADVIPRDYYDKVIEELCKMHQNAIIVDIKYGKWIFDNPLKADFKCSVCLERNDICTRFCPNCGADMRGDNDEQMD